MPQMQELIPNRRTEDRCCACPVCGQDWVPSPRLSIASGRVIWAGTCLPFTATEASIFIFLYNNRGIFCSTERLFTQINTRGGPEIVKVHIARIRSKLITYHVPFEINGKHKYGYQLVERRSGC